MAVEVNPDLDSISAFVKSGNTVTATVSFTAVYAPSFVTNVHTYAVGKKIYISGSETPANDGEYTVTAVGSDFISYTNPNGVTQSRQFALASSINLSIIKGVVGPSTVAAATPFSYVFTSPAGWNPPPVYMYRFNPTLTYGSSYTNVGSTTHTVTTLTLPLVVYGYESPTEIIYDTHELNNLYPYKFFPSLALPIVANGNSYSLTFEKGTYRTLNFISSSYSVGLPLGVALDSVNGVLYVVDSLDGLIRKIVLSTGVESIVAGGGRFYFSLGGSSPVSRDGFGTAAGFVNPFGLALDQARQLLYVSEQSTGKIRMINLATLEVTTERAGSGADTALGLAFNSATNVLYIANADAVKIVARNLNNDTETDITVDFNFDPAGLALDSPNNKLYSRTRLGSFYVTDFGSAGVTSLMGSVNYGSELSIKRSIAVVGGVLYATDSNRIYRITQSPFAATVFAGSSSSGSADGVGAAARFNDPVGIVIDVADNKLYVADRGNNTIRRVLITSATVDTNVLGIFPSGSNAIIIGGTTYLYSTPPTITLVPGSDAASYRIGFNGILSPSIVATDRGGQYAGDGPYATITPRVTLKIASTPSIPSLIFDYFGPLPIDGRFDPVPPLIEDGGSSTDLLPFINYQGTTATVAAPQGFPYVPSEPLTYSFRLVGEDQTLYEAYSNTITVVPIPITSAPVFPVPFLIYVYTPFSYVFSISGAVNITLSYSTSSSNLLSYLSLDAGDTRVNFNSAVGSPTALTGTLTILARAAEDVIVGALTSPVTFLLPSIVGRQVIPSPEVFISPGTQINLYKYEPFNYAFTITGVNPPLTLQYNRSSAQLLPYITSVNATSIALAGTPPASYASTFGLVIDIIGASGNIPVSTVSYPVTISAARLIFTPPSPYLLDKFTNLSNTLGSVIAISGSNLPTSLFSTPGLPAGLSFSGLSIVGTPQVEQTARNYLIIGSNSTTTQISTANISIRVGPSAVRILPSSVSFTSLSASSTPTATFTSILPDAIYKSSFVYTWDRPLPSGLVFTNSSGVPLPFPPFAPSDPSQSINLSGSPDLTDASGFPSSGLVTVVLSGIYRDIANVQTVGQSTLNFQFAETVFMSTSVSPTIYVGKQLEPTDVVVTAASFFPNTSPITTFIITGLPPEFTVQVVSTTQRRLVGTPLTAGTNSYTATATNANGVTKSIALVVTVNPNTASFSSSTPPNGSSVDFIVSRPLSLANPIRFFASSTSDSVVTYSSSLDFAAYGLAFSSSTGELTGTPTSSLIATPVTVTATDTFGATATTELNVTIDADEFTFPTATFQFFQNRAITPYQFVVTTTSGRPIQSFSSTSLPPGLFLGPSGLLMGTFTGSTNGNFTVDASTGYQPPAIPSQTYSYTAVPDNLLIVQVNGVDTIGTVFSNVQYRTLQYSVNSFVDPVYSVAYVSPVTSPEPILTITQSGFLSGDFTGVASFSSYTAAITASYQGVTSTSTITFQSNTVFIPSGVLEFTQPTQSNASLYQYVPYTFPVRATGSGDFIYYFSEGIPLGFTFAPDPTGTSATLSGISPSNGATDVTFYAKTASAPATKKTFRLNTVIPFFVNQQIGAAAYTALVRKHVDADAAQNARDNKVFPEVNPLAGPFMAPHAPDTVTLSNCFLGLCKKPCPTCRTTM